MARYNIPPLTRALFLSLVGLTLLNAVITPDFHGFRPITRTGNGTPYLSLIPGISYRFPWTFATASLVEQNIPGLIITGLVLFFGGRYLERAYGSVEYAKFILFSTVLPNVMSFIFYFLLYFVSGSNKALTTTISGGISIQASFLVAFKQLVPEHTVSLVKGTIRLRVKHFPAIFLVANTISGLVIGTDTAMFGAWLGFAIAWVYLRFYRVSPTLDSGAAGTDGAESGITSVKGDASDTFAFAYFFPEPLQTPIAAISDRVWELLCTLGLCSPFSADDVESGNAQASARADGHGTLPSSSRSTAGKGVGIVRREEAERRRALALRALDERLHAAATRGQGVGSTPAKAVTADSIAAAPVADSDPGPNPAAPSHVVEK